MQKTRPVQTFNEEKPTKEDWDFRGVDTQYATHGMHTWLAAMIPQEARKLIQVTEAREVLDPFCGGGTVLVECGYSGVPARGLEINPLGVIISNAKVTKIPILDLYEELSGIMERIKGNAVPKDIFPVGHQLDYWFKPYMFEPLGKLVSAIQKIEDKKMKNFFQCVFSATARDVSLTYRNEIRLRRMSPKEQSKFNPDVIAQFAYRAMDSIKRLREIPECDVQAVNGTALEMPFKNKQFTTVITSPPYGDERNGVPYLQFSKNMLYLLGWTREDLMRSKSMTLGWLNHNHREFEMPPSRTLKRLMKSITNERTLNEAVAFYSDYFRSLKEMKRVTSDRIAIVIGNRVLQNQVFNNGEITTELLQEIDVRLDKKFERNLPSKRLPKMREFGAAINKEDILIYKV